MNPPTLRRLFLALLLGLATAATAADPARAAAVADIRAERLAQNTAIVAHDLDGIAAAWTDDVVIQRGLGAQAVGKAAYLKLFADDAPGAIVYQRFPETIEVSATWPLAFETGHWEGRQGGKPVIKGRYSAHWVKRGDRWLIRGEVYVALEGLDAGKDLKAVP